jgi:DNA repair exonuclease SbcCD ATPase subunit
MWLDDCDHAVRLFLQYSDNGNISFWTETMVQSSTNIHVGGLCALLAGLCLPFNDDSTTDRQLAQNVIVTTVGIDKFIDKLDQVRKSEEFSFAQQRRFQILPDDDNKIIYDFDYTLFFNNAYDRIVRRLRPPQNVAANSQTSLNSITQEEHSRIVQNFKDLIREQDRQLSELRRKNEELEKKLQQTTQELSLCKTKGVSSSSNGLGLNSELEKHLRQELENTTKQLEWRTKELTELKKKIEKGGEAPNATELQRLRQENEELQKKVMELKKAKKTLKEKVTTLEDEKRQLRDRLSQMEKQINANNINSSNLEVLSKKVDQLTKELEAAQQKYAALEQEQEELLVCLAKTELANKELKKKLGLPVEDDDDEDKEQQPK